MSFSKRKVTLPSFQRFLPLYPFYFPITTEGDNYKHSNIFIVTEPVINRRDVLKTSHP